MSHEGLPVAGYRPQSDANVLRVNENKLEEEVILRKLDLLAQDDGIDKRWLAIARTQFEQAYMALNRSILRPERVSLPSE